MRKAVGVLSLMLLGLCLGEAQSTWKLSNNVLATSNQISFNHASKGTWYFLQSSSIVHDPKTYQLLPLYSLPCNLLFQPSKTIIIDAPCWETAIPDAEGAIEPIIGANVFYKTQVVAGFVLPPRSVWMHPSKFGYAIIGWQSPISGFVNVEGFFSDLDPTCGNGVNWFVDKGGHTLASGTLSNGSAAQPVSLTAVSVSAGQVLYFGVGPNGDYHCDSTGVDITVAKAN